MNNIVTTIVALVLLGLFWWYVEQLDKLTDVKVRRGVAMIFGMLLPAVFLVGGYFGARVFFKDPLIRYLLAVLAFGLCGVPLGLVLSEVLFDDVESPTAALATRRQSPGAPPGRPPGAAPLRPGSGPSRPGGPTPGRPGGGAGPARPGGSGSGSGPARPGSGGSGPAKPSTGESGPQRRPPTPPPRKPPGPGSSPPPSSKPRPR